MPLVMELKKPKVLPGSTSYDYNTVETSVNVLNSTCHDGLLLHHIFHQTYPINLHHSFLEIFIPYIGSNKLLNKCYIIHHALGFPAQLLCSLKKYITQLTDNLN